MNTLLSLDIGTSSTRALLYDAQTATALPGATAQRQRVVARDADGGETADPERLVRDTIACCVEVLKKAPPGCRIVGVGVSSFWHSVIAVDERGAPQTPILLWSDRRSAPQVARLKARCPDLPQRTGCPWHTSFAYGKLTWLEETRPERYPLFLSPAEYLFSRLFGLEKTVCSPSMASASGLFDQLEQAWLPEFADRLRPIADTPASGLRAPFAAKLPALAAVPWFPALGDGACSNIGCGATDPGCIALMIGTSGAMRAAVPGAIPPPLPDGLWRYQLAAERFLLGGALSNGGAVWNWLTRTVRLGKRIEAQLRAQEPDAHGLTVLPFLSGERAPLWRDDLSAAIVGISAATGPADLARAHLEAVAYRFAALRDRLRAAVPSAELIGTGAALLAAPVWQQILADTLGEPIALSSEKEASARGAALWARERLGLGEIDDAPQPPLLGRVEPDPQRTARYARGRARHEALRARLLD